MPYGTNYITTNCVNQILNSFTSTIKFTIHTKIKNIFLKFVLLFLKDF